MTLTEALQPTESAEPAELVHLREQVRLFMAEQRAESGWVAHCDSWMTSYSPEFSRALGAKGWLGLTWPTSAGGAGRTERERLVLNEELLAAGAPVAAHWFADRQTGPALLKHGTPEQQARFLPPIIRGECYFAIGMSEPGSGSDLASVRTKATRTSGGWKVSGTKVWTSHAHRAHFMLALVRTAPLDSSVRHAGLSQMIVDLHAPGVQVRPIRSLDGTAHFCEVVLDGVELGHSAVLGPEGSGWEQVTSELAYERSGPERFLSTAPLLFAMVQRAGPEHIAELGGLLAELQTLRGMSFGVAEALQQGRAPVLQAAIVKDLGTVFEGRVVDAARRVLNVEPDLSSDDDAVRLLAEAIVHRPESTLRGGTNQILRGIIARTLTST